MNLNIHKLNDDEKPFHSSVYAKAANQNRIGSVSSLSFNQRLNIDSNRQMVNPYRHSAMGNSRGVLKAKQFERPNISQEPNKRPGSSLQQHNSISQSKAIRFNEPISRGYNPFA